MFLKETEGSTTVRYIPFVIIGSLTLIMMIRNVVNGKFSEKESFFWAIAGLIMITSPLYMDYVDRFSIMVGVSYTPALIFALVFIFVFFLLYRLSAAVYRLNERITELIQLNAIYEHEIRKLSNNKDNTDIIESEHSNILESSSDQYGY